MPVLVDTSALYALADVKTVEHGRVRSYVQSSTDLLVLPVTVLPEAGYLISTHLGSHVAAALLRSVVSGEFRVEGLGHADLARCLELMEAYSDTPIGLVDASIVAIAERLHIGHVLTLDRRHFRMLRPRHVSAFTLAP
ncbi:MAG: PIN domain-containing protein [Chloroflexi bacterium]|nr:PIN domain-containing protein [Chloroflexota bacterium]